VRERTCFTASLLRTHAVLQTDAQRRKVYWEGDWPRLSHITNSSNPSNISHRHRLHGNQNLT